MNTITKHSVKQKLTTKDLVLCAIFTTLIIIGTFLKIPTPIIPITFQVMFTNLAGLMLGSRRGAISSGIYVLLGLIGIPVFSSGGGIGYILYPTFGYLIGFVVGAYAAGRVVEKRQDNSLGTYILASMVNLAIVYGIGVLYLYLMKNYYQNAALPLSKALMVGFLTPLPSDIFAIGISCLLLKKVMPAIKSYLQ